MQQTMTIPSRVRSSRLGTALVLFGTFAILSITERPSLAQETPVERGPEPTSTSTPSSSSTDPSTPESLPEPWWGTWSGRCRVVRFESGPDLEVPTTLRIARLSQDEKGGDDRVDNEAPRTLSWTLIYGEGDGRQVRDYTIHPLPDQPGRFLIDEGNGIQLPCTLVDDVLHSAFQVESTILVARYALRDDRIHLEIASYRTTGDADDNRAVPTLRLIAIQSGILIRANDPGVEETVESPTDPR